MTEPAYASMLTGDRPVEVEHIRAVWNAVEPPGDLWEMVPDARDLEGFEPGPPVLLPVVERFPDTVNVADLLPPETGDDWHIEGAFRRGTMVLLAGAVGVGKTHLRKELEHRLALGLGPLWGTFDITGRRRVLVIDEDNGEREEYMRDETHLAALGCTRADLLRLYRVSWSGLRLEQPESQAWLREQVERLRIDVLILDPVGRLYAAKELREELSPVVRFLRGLLRDQPTLGVLLVHHLRKPPAGKANEGLTLADVRGAEWADRSDVVMLVSSLGERRVKVELHKRIAPASVILEQGPGGPFVFVSTGETREQRASNDDRVLACIDSGATSADEIILATSIPKRTVYAALRRLRIAAIVADGTPLRRLEEAS